MELGAGLRVAAPHLEGGVARGAHRVAEERLVRVRGRARTRLRGWRGLGLWLGIGIGIGMGLGL